MRLTRSMRFILLALVGAFLLAGCGGDDGNASGQGGGSDAANVAREDINIIYVLPATAADPFFSRIQNGIDQAAEDMGVEVDFRAPETFDMVEMGRLIEAATASEPDGLVVSIADEDALEDPIRQAVDAGIPVVAINSGREVYKDLGILSYVGQLEYEAGVEAGERMANEGVDNAVCINQDVGVYTLEQRCEGFAEGLGGQVETVAVDTTDPSGARSRVQNYVRQNEDINGMMGLGSTAGEAAIDAAAALGDRDIQIATFDLSPAILRAIRDGDMLFTVDQQQYLQGYLPVVMLTLYNQYGTMPQNEVQTGPAFVTQENAEEVLDLSEADIR
jgi:simple sugar transport system substrate-binding protein